MCLPVTRKRFRQGYRYGGGQALAVIQPGTLVEMWRVFQACQKVAMIFQAANWPYWWLHAGGRGV